MSTLLPPLSLAVAVERFPIAGIFTISRGSRTEAVVVTAVVSGGGFSGRGECVPYSRYDESVESVAAQIAAQSGFLSGGADRQTLLHIMEAGAARNALDCALWDYEAKASGRPVWEIAGLEPPRPVPTCYTISLGAPEAMEAAAAKAAGHPILKIKLGGAGDPERIEAVRRGAPDTRLVVDANEAWSEASFEANAAACADAGVELIEQPFPAKADAGLALLKSPVPICADESAHVASGLGELCDRYQAVNIKLDKTGGLTEAIAMAHEALRLGLDIMTGCMVGSSLAMAPATMLAPLARWVDLDGPLLLARDREDGLIFKDGLICPPTARLWG